MLRTRATSRKMRKEQEVEAAEQGPVGDTVTGSEPHRQTDTLVPSTFLLSLCPCPEATTVHSEIRPRWVHGQDNPINRPPL